MLTVRPLHCPAAGRGLPCAAQASRMPSVTGHFRGRGIWDRPSCAPVPTRSVPAGGSRYGTGASGGIEVDHGRQSGCRYPVMDGLDEARTLRRLCW
jgi:hypothetical protein